jgi:hypothetical protein
VVTNAVNDLGCRFVDGAGQPRGRSRFDACTFFENGEFHFVEPNSTSQFCAGIAEPFAFPVGDTTVEARLRDTSGRAGPSAAMIIRVLP